MPPATLQAIHEALDGTARSAVEIWGDLNLGRYCKASVFRRYAADRKRDREARGTPAGPPVAALRDELHAARASADLPPPPNAARILAMVLENVARDVAAGELPPYEYAKLIGALIKREELDLRTSAEERARELHALKVAELRRAVTTATEGEDGQERQLTRQAAMDLIDQVMRGGA